MFLTDNSVKEEDHIKEKELNDSPIFVQDNKSDTSLEDKNNSDAYENSDNKDRSPFFKKRKKKLFN